MNELFFERISSSIQKRSWYNIIKKEKNERIGQLCYDDGKWKLYPEIEDEGIVATFEARELLEIIRFMIDLIYEK
jgi:hypothetical protein